MKHLITSFGGLSNVFYNHTMFSWQSLVFPSSRKAVVNYSDRLVPKKAGNEKQFYFWTQQASL